MPKEAREGSEPAREPSPTPAPARATAPAEAPVAALRALSADAGNHAVTRMIQRLTLPGPKDDRAGAGGSGPVAPRDGQHGSGQTADFTPFDVEGASEEEKLGELRQRVPAGDRATVTAIWRSFADVPGVARAHPDLYAASTRLVPAGSPLKLHPFAVRAAEKRGVLVAGMPGYDEARAWKESFAGHGARDRNVILIELGEHRKVLRKWTAARKRRRAAMDELKAATEAGRPDAEVARLRAEWEAARAEEQLQSARVDIKERDRLANDAKYRALVEEADAYRVQEEYEALLAARREGRTPVTPTRTVDVGAPSAPEPIRPDPIRDVGGPADDLDGTTHVDSVHDLDDPTHVDSVHDVELPTDSEPPTVRR